jgi:hypothetical protein
VLIVYGPKPGTEVSFPLKISPPSEIEDGKGGKLTIPPKRGVDGDAVIRVTAKVPSEADRREIDAHLSRATVESADGNFRIVSSREAHSNWRAAAIKKLIVRIDELQIVDPSAPTDLSKALAIVTPQDLLTYADDDVINAIVDVVMDRIRLSEALAGKFDGRSSSSPAVTTPPVVTAETAGGMGSAQLDSAIAPPIARTST